MALPPSATTPHTHTRHTEQRHTHTHASRRAAPNATRCVVKQRAAHCRGRPRRRPRQQPPARPHVEVLAVKRQNSAPSVLPGCHTYNYVYEMDGNARTWPSAEGAGISSTCSTTSPRRANCSETAASFGAQRMDTLSCTVVLLGRTHPQTTWLKRVCSSSRAATRTTTAQRRTSATPQLYLYYAPISVCKYTVGT